MDSQEQDAEPGVASRAVHAGERQDLPRRPASVAVHLTAPFVFESAADLDRAFAGSLADKSPAERNTLYSRYGNPSVRVVEEKLAALEGAEDAVAAASGMGAIAATLSTLLASGDRLLSAADVYGGTLAWLGWLRRRHPEIEVETVPLAGLVERLEQPAAPRPRVVYLETPTNPLLSSVDLAAAARAARQAGAVLVVDNTFATPVLQTPLALGAHVVVHSATKFLAGHHDVTAGLAAADAETVAAIRETVRVCGAPLDPHAAFLVARGMRTLPLRMERQSENAQALASFLREQPQVRRVFYPGFDPVARRQMASGGAMVAFELAGDARAFVDRLRLVRILPSLGGVETGVILPAATSHRELPAEERRRLGIGEQLVRMSVGIEDAADLERDLARGLAAP